MKVRTPILLAAAAALLTVPVPAEAGPPWISIEIPTNPHRPVTRGARFLVRTYHHWLPVEATLTGTAEGLVNGTRRSIALSFEKAPVPGTQAVRAHLPSEGAWVMVIRAANLDGAGVIVSLAADGSVMGAEVPANTTNDGWQVPRGVTDAEVDTALRKHAAQLASAERKAPLGLALGMLAVVALLPVGLAARP